MTCDGHFFRSTRKVAITVLYNLKIPEVQVEFCLEQQIVGIILGANES